ncbi:MAG: hypothetical protein OXB95_04925 [Rhodobacteraceae bacterium]|nr:hypothetical protein [Paracoccaceae bacterium]
MKKFQSGVSGEVSLTQTPKSLVNLLFVLFRQRHETLARRFGYPLGTKGAGLGRYIGPVLLG